MFQYGKQIVTERFGQVNVLFAIDLLIEGVVRSFNRTIEGVANFIPIPGLDAITKVIGAILYAMTTYIDETIFSYSLARGDKNPWLSGKDGLIYYAQNSKEILKTSIGIVILEKVLTITAFLILLAPSVLLLQAFPNALGWTGFVFAALVAWNIQGAFLKPLFLIMIMTKFHVSAKDQAIDLTSDARLDKVSKKFRELKDGITQWVDENVPSAASSNATPEPLPAGPASSASSTPPPPPSNEENGPSDPPPPPPPPPPPA